MELGKKLAECIRTKNISYALGPIVPARAENQFMFSPPPVATAESFEILARPEGIASADIQAAFAQFHAHQELWDAVPLLISQQTKIDSRGCMPRIINLSPSYLGDKDVQRELRDILMPRSGLLRRRRAISNFGFEIMETSELAGSGVAFVQELKRRGATIKLDDLGSGAHADHGYLCSLASLLDLDEIKLDFSLVRGKSPGDVGELARKWLEVIEGFWPGKALVIEGVPVCPYADMLEVPGEFHPVFEEGRETSRPWRLMMIALEERFNRPIWAQLRSVPIKS